MATPSDRERMLPSQLMADETIELRLIRVMGTEIAPKRPVSEQFLSHVPEYRFAIHRRVDGLRVGRIHIRVTNDPVILHSVGHTGYAVDEQHRGNGYASRAIRLISELARYWDVLPLWVLIEPENTASRRAAERAGLTLVDTIDSSPESRALGTGEKVCRYRLAK